MKVELIHYTHVNGVLECFVALYGKETVNLTRFQSRIIEKHFYKNPLLTEEQKFEYIKKLVK